MTRETTTRETTTRRAGSRTPWIHRACTLAIVFVFVVTANLTPAAWAEHLDQRQTERLAGLAYELEQAAHDAYHLTHEYAYGPIARDLMRDFQALERAASQFSEEARYARSPQQATRELHRLAERYYEARLTFRGFHGSTHVRQAFHRINRPMEILYRSYTGRDLYRDDPYVRQAHRYERPRTRGRERGEDRRLDRDRDRRLDRPGRDGSDGRGRRNGRNGRGGRGGHDNHDDHGDRGDRGVRRHHP